MRINNGFPNYYDPRKGKLPPVIPPPPVVPAQPVTPTVPAPPVTPMVPAPPVTPTVPAPPVTPMVPAPPVTPMVPPPPVTPMVPPPPVTPVPPMIPVMPCPQFIYPKHCPYMNIFGKGNASSLEGMYDIMSTDLDDIGPATAATSDPPPVLSNNPAAANILLFKELTGFPAYGNPSGNADILYTGNRGTWTFDIPPFLFVPGNLRMQLIIRAVLDDHTIVPVDRYSARITVNGNVVHTGRVPLEHGRPQGGRFINWSELTFNVPTMRRSTRVVIDNTSTTGTDDWIGLDWMQLRLISR